jgi:hypothetical protein
MKNAILASLAVSLALAAPALAQDKTCAKADAARAEKAIDAVTSFAQLHKAWQDWKQCDSGPVAEVFTDAAFRLLVDWKGIDGLASSLQASPEYKSWLLARVKAGTKEDRAAIFSRAKTGCPARHDAMCAELVQASGDEAPKAAPAPGTAPANPAK